jgi:hypothetical protein
MVEDLWGPPSMTQTSEHFDTQPTVALIAASSVHLRLRSVP